MSRYKPYPAYEDSGVEWIGKVPEHWAILPFFTVAREISRSNKGMIESKVLSLSYGKVIPKRESENVGLVPESYETYQIVEPGEIVFRFTDLQNDKNSLRSAQVKERGIITSAYLAVKASNINETYLAWLMRAYDHCKVFYTLGGGLRQSLKYSDVKRLPLLIPPLDEQCRSVTFIDLETKRIDSLITKKTRFIELLKEKRQALIAHAVTKGLDPNVKMKDSGVEWLGQVPEHWRVVRMASIFHEAIRLGDAFLPILSISIHDGISDEEVAAEDRDRRVSKIEDKTKYKRVAPNDLAYNMMRAWQGAFGAVTVDGLVSPAYVVAEPIVELRTAYIENMLRTPMAIEEMRRYSRGIADFRMRLYWDYFRDLKVCLPPLDEQDYILSTTIRESSRIDSLTEKTQQSIELLKERRSAFITAAVTGQIDLREPA